MPIRLPKSSSPSALYAVPAGLILLLTLLKLNPVLILSSGGVACLLMVLVKTGMEFSSDNRSSRQYYSLLGWKVGNWQPLPEIVGITVKYFSELIPRSGGNRNWGVWNDAPRREEELVIMLSVKNKSIGIIIGYFPIDEQEQALEFAHHIAANFQVPVHTFLPTSSS